MQSAPKSKRKKGMERKTEKKIVSEKKKEKTTSKPLRPPPNPNRVVPVDTQLKYCIKYVKSMIVYQRRQYNNK